MTTEEINEKALELNAFDSRLRELEQALALLDGQLAEFQMCGFSLDEIENLKKSSEMFAPIGAGIFVKTALADNSEVLVDVGAKVICKKNLQEAREIIEKKLGQLTKLRSQIANETQILVQRIMQIEQQIREFDKKE